MKNESAGFNWSTGKNIKIQVTNVKIEKVEKAVQEDPGITFTELKEKLGLENGQLQYHLKNSKTVQKEKGYVTKEICRECDLKEICRKECIRTVLRSEKRKKVCRKLENKPKKEIAEELSISCSALSYHLDKLEEAGVTEEGTVVSGVENLI